MYYNLNKAYHIFKIKDLCFVFGIANKYKCINAVTQIQIVGLWVQSMDPCEKNVDF